MAFASAQKSASSGSWFPVGPMSHPREVDAGRMADRAMQAPANGRVPPAAQTKSEPAVGNAGQPLDRATRQFFEPRFGHDFSGVRVHADGRAAEAAGAMDASAFSLGQHLFFAAERYAPSTTAGKTLIAHELAHVIQQDENGGPPVVRRAPDEKKTPAKSGPEPFFHGTTWRIAQQIPGNVKPLGGGDFGQGFYTHHDASPSRAQERARAWACRLSRESKPPEKYAGVIRFDVPQDEYRKLFSSRKTFDFTSTRDPDYAKKQKEWLDFVSGPGRGREAKPVYDPKTGFWRHPRSNPDPDLGYDLIEGPFYRGVPGVLDPNKEPPRSAFDPYNEGTELPQQILWNHDRAMAVLNAATTTLTQYDVDDECKPVPQPHALPPGAGATTESREAQEAAQRGMTDIPMA